MSKKLSFAILTLSLMFVGAACNRTTHSSPLPPFKPLAYKTGTMTIGSATVNVQVADTEVLRAAGLSDRDVLGANDGMIFIFPTPDQYAFWMKGMRFPLDFVWIKAGTVAQITPNVPVEPNVLDKDLRTYLPANPVDSVLEVNAGWAEAHQIKVGDGVLMTQ